MGGRGDSTEDEMRKAGEATGTQQARSNALRQHCISDNSPEGQTDTHTHTHTHTHTQTVMKRELEKHPTEQPTTGQREHHS